MGDWARYRRSPDVPLEVMRAHFERHAYHRHAHDTYSLGVTEAGAQTFTCRGGTFTSAGGMVMAFNPDDPHDGHAANRLGFTYRMVHIGPELMAGVLRDAAERPVGLPLFAEPVVTAPEVARRLLDLSNALLDETPTLGAAGPNRQGSPLDRGGNGLASLRHDELLTRVVWAITRHSRRRASPSGAAPLARVTGADVVRVAERARAVLDEAGLAEVSAGRLAEATGRSRFTVYRSFQARYGLSPSDYQRQLRVRAARRMLGDGVPAARAAALAGFADQSHLNRWFLRYFGITPGAFQRALVGPG
ncbi:AraC family transcriptional regulator [Rugosimonospora africana]|uniref:AraC family transcriptional regulator n=1 Tax=Rugosimonospora africana TaxID=556532 RepID=A0A8J3VMG8_9ACTN|nr:AraC family transcriptional regulator [Rugosimonospora africana]GIH11965.1 AraC family transcriptional regulator [Rugosimonospora africana]